MSNKVYEIVTGRIIEKLEQGEIPWHMPWSSELPKNLVSGKTYRGINVFLLGSMGYSSPYWLTFHQANNLGGHVTKGEKSTMVVFWKMWDRENTDGEKESIPVLRYFRVFNVDQVSLPTEKMPADPVKNDIEPIPLSRAIVANWNQCPEITHGEPRAYYRPSTDTVNMPQPESFEGSEGYYSTLFHELTHSTGHESRLNRPGIVELTGYGTRDYSKEELIAEMGAAFLCAVTGIEDRILDNSAAYIQGWLKRLSNDPKMVVLAAAQAQKAADFIQGQPTRD